MLLDPLEEEEEEEEEVLEEEEEEEEKPEKHTFEPCLARQSSGNGLEHDPFVCNIRKCIPPTGDNFEERGLCNGKGSCDGKIRIQRVIASFLCFLKRV